VTHICLAESEGVHILRLSDHYGQLSTILQVVSLQLMAYYVAFIKGK
jgi:glutamine---fructose-6-phosphate transaminase (isomerizing)